MKVKHLSAVICFLLLFSALLPAEGIINHQSGTYSGDIFISLKGIKNNDNVFYSFGLNDAKPEIPYLGGFLLSSIPGEERTYNLNIRINDEIYNYHYVIDKKTPSLPELDFINSEQGYGYTFISSGKNEAVYYGFDDYREGKTLLWKGEIVPPPKNGFIYYYAEDEAGNRSKTEIIVPEKEAAAYYRQVLNVRSPVEGEFSNTQLLYIDREGFDWIKYTLNGYDPVETGVEYNGPVEIRRYGTIKLRIAAKPEGSEQIIDKEIEYRVNTKAPLKNIPSSGIYSSEVKISKLSEGYYYCMDERTPSFQDRIFENDLNINPVYGGVKYTVLRISNLNEESSGDFRYFYVIDDRFPASPLITFSDRQPAERHLEVSIKGPSYSDIYYTTDGSSPGLTSNLYKDNFSINIPDDKNAGSVIVKARALSLNGKPSNVVSKIYTYDTKKPETPTVDIIKNESTGIYQLEYDIPDDETLYYALTDENFDEPDFDFFSPITDKDFFLDIPKGTADNFNFIFSSVDSSGNQSDYTEIIEVSIDKRVPQLPEILFENNIITIKSDDSIKYNYSFIRNGTVLESAEGVYTSPVKISEEHFNCTINIEAVIIDQFGNSIKSSYIHYLPIKNGEKETAVFSRKSEDIYSGEEVAFYAYPDGINDELFYYLTELTTSENNKTLGPFETDGYITITGEENRKVDYYLEVFSVDRDTGEQSNVNNYEFTIDNEKPEIPYISGLDNYSVSNDRVILKASGDPDSVIFLNFSETESDLGRLFSNKSIIFNKPLIFDVKSGEEKNFFLKLGAGDSAGNSVENPEIFHFVIDKKSPEISLPELTIDDQNYLNITFNDDEEVRYYYEFGLKGTDIKVPDRDSISFENGLQFNRNKYKDDDLVFMFCSEDAAGNINRYPTSFMVSIDNEKPVIGEPSTFVDEKSRKVFISWDSEENKIFYSTDNEWSEYTNPFSLTYDSSELFLDLNYYSVDSEGNQSSRENLRLNLPATVTTELASGIKSNSQYNSDLTLKKTEDSGIVRYEIATDKILPPDVTVFSPVLPDVLPFRIEKGESVDFIVSLKEYSSENDTAGGAEQIIRFSIDKQIPEPPVIAGINDGEYYLEDCNAYFEPSTDKIFYSIRNNLNTEQNFIEYTGPFDINSPNGSYNTFSVEAYTQDFSGNKSTVESWEITIDKEIIYVSENGRDYFEGTRSKPFRTLNKALEQIRHSNRKTVFLDEGTYYLKSPGIIDESISIYGGFKSGSWHDKTGDSFIVVNSEFPEENPAFYIYGGNLSLENISLKITNEMNNSVFFVNKGNLNILNSKIDIDCSSGANILKQMYGKFTVNNTEFTGVTGINPLIENEYGIANINNSIFNFKSPYGSSNLISTSNSVDYNVSSSDFYINGGEKFTVVKAFNSSLTFKSDNFRISGFSINAAVFECVDSKLNLDYCRITETSDNRYSRVLVSEDSSIDVKGNTFNVDAGSGIIGFNLTGGSSYFQNNRMYSTGCRDFLYQFIISGGNHNVETNIINTGNADDIVLFRTHNSELGFFNNNVNIDSEDSSVYGFKAETDSTVRMINNIINVNNLTSESYLMFSEKAENMLSIKNNNIYGWKYLMSGFENAADLISLDLLDDIYSGGRFSDNISEDPENTFIENSDHILSENSSCIDSGMDLSNIIIQKTDFDGEIRPNRSMNSNPAFDIGVDEYYE